MSLQAPSIVSPTERNAAAISLLSGWLAARLAPEAFAWFQSELQRVQQEGGMRSLARALGYAPRRLGKADLAPTDSERKQARALQPGFDPSQWSVDQVSRVAFVLSTFHGDEPAFATQLESLATTAEVNELVALYLGFALYPAPLLIEPRAREAVRSSITPLFEAIALRNPYPKERFDEAAWDQMIVKAVFMGCKLWPIQGLDIRGNPELSRMLVALAHERWAAGRTISAEIWRCVAPHADALGQEAMRHALAAGSEHEKLAVALALHRFAPDSLGSVRAEVERLGLAERVKTLDWADIAAPDRR